ncbi:alpha/beta-hydrolase [Microthyrium microscopicum]|uniref:Alpha/beta-hydrolase n=1 Tax=Microthyrium microscopicum TaxID=703497 RepID=A0A6A6UG89_9PEZI|nr:alpha/beta-hydrolase [Microthyrium microscopicum]
MRFPLFSPSSGIVLLALLSYSYAQNVSSLISGSTTCNGTCPELVTLSSNFEHSAMAHSPLDDFYSVPANFSPSMKPGMLLRIEPHTNLTNYTVPSSLTMSRIIYTSESLNGTVVPVSAFVLWPYAPYQYNDQGSSKYPLVAWAHGTSGQFASCAPSNYRSLQYHFMTSYTIATEGFVVVATDYAGLGVNTAPNGESSHLWLAGPVGANDVAYAIEAVRKAFPDQLDADGPFVTMGHSQGGNVAYAFAERQAKTPVPGYRGTVAISPPTRVVELINRAQEMFETDPPATWPIWVPLVLSFPPKFIAAVTAAFPAYNYSGMTPLAYDRWNNVLKPLQGCLPTDGFAFYNLSIPSLSKPNWTSNSYVQKWNETVFVSGNKFSGPLLVLAGEKDVIPIDMIEESLDSSCKFSPDQSAEMVTYTAMQHFPVISASRMKWLGWIKEKVSNSSASKEKAVCGKKSVVTGFNTNYTLQFVTPNWLVDLVPSTDMWKLSF